MLKENLEQLFEFIAKHIPSEEIIQAKIEYQKTAGEVYEDNKSYNIRMALFLEWYLLDNYVPRTQKTILENIVEKNQSTWIQDHLDVCKDISNNIQALFEVKKVHNNLVTVLDLFRGEKHQINEKNLKLVFRKKIFFKAALSFIKASGIPQDTSAFIQVKATGT